MTFTEAMDTYRDAGQMWTTLKHEGIEFHIFYIPVEADPYNGVKECKEPVGIYLGGYDVYDVLDVTVAGHIIDKLQDTPHFHYVASDA